jgi:hypothetical protein
VQNHTTPKGLVLLLPPAKRNQKGTKAMPADKLTYMCRLRLRNDLRQRLDIAARKRGITKTQEIIARLEKSFADPDPIVELTTTMKQLLAMRSGEVDA